jgi:hypothetical protein
MSLIFLHIPKTGGKTFKGVLFKQNYRGRILEKPWNISSEDWIKLVKKTNKKYKAIIGHMPFGIHNVYKFKGFEYITILRNPIDRVISNYYHFMRNPSSKFKNKSFIDALDMSVDFNNLQTRMLSGDISIYNCITGKFEQIIYDENLLNKAKENLKKIKIVGFLDQYRTFLNKVEKHFKWKHFDSYNYNNIGKNKKPKQNIPKNVIEKIKHLNQMDIELYNWAKNNC